LRAGITKTGQGELPLKNTENDFGTLLDLLPDLVFSLDSSGRFTYANSRTEEFFGCHVDELLGKQLWEFVLPENEDEARTLVDTPADSCWDREFYIEGCRGKIKYVRARCRPRLDDTGRIISFHGTIRDRTPQRELEEKLAAYQAALKVSETRYRNLVEEVPDIIFSLDPQGRFIFVNARLEELLGYPIPRVLGSYFWDYVYPEDRECAEAIMETEPDSVWDQELTVLDYHGGTRWVRVRCKPLKDSEGRVVELEGVIRDRTKRKKLEDELKASKKELLEKIKIIDDLYEHIVQSEKSKAIAQHTAEVAHELRQPLAIIGGFVRRMIKQTEGSQKLDTNSQKECFTVILREVQRLEKILAGLIDFTRQKSIKLQKVDPNVLIEKVLRLNEERLRDKEIRLELNFGEEVGEIPLDPDRFEQVIRNLVSNAVDASRQQGMIRIETGVFVPSDKAQETGGLESEAYFEMKIRNGGKVISPEDLRKIFDPFYTTKDHGLGVGLTLAKRIVEEHRGSISVKSDEKGTVFVIWIPLRDANSERYADSSLKVASVNPID